MKITILTSAQRDLIDGYWFYENQEAGLGSYFLDSLYSDIDSLHIYAGIHRLHFGKYHRTPSWRNPYDRKLPVDVILLPGSCRRFPHRLYRKEDGDR